MTTPVSALKAALDAHAAIAEASRASAAEIAAEREKAQAKAVAEAPVTAARTTGTP